MIVVARLVFLCVCASFFCGDLRARSVGSNTAVARQAATFYPSADTNNQMLGFSVFERGVMLADNITSCTYNSTFPVSGSMALNGGTLFLLQGLDFKPPYYLGPGVIDGQALYSLGMGAGSPEIQVPAQGFQYLLSPQFSTTVGGYIYSLDWSHDGKYILLGRASAADNELQIFYVAQDQTITLTAGLETGANVYSVRWHPSSYYFALGKASSNYLETYSFVPETGEIIKIDGAVASSVNAVAWNPQGTQLAVGLSSGINITVYDVENGVLGTAYTAPYTTGSRSVQRNAISWDADGKYFAIGCNSSSTTPDLFVLCSTGTAVYKVAEAEVGGTVYTVAWHPSLPYIAAGISTGSDRLPLFYFDESAGSVTNAGALASAARNVYALAWDHSGTRLAATTATTTYGFDVNIFAFDAVLKRLNITGGWRVGTSFYAVAWSGDDSGLCLGESAGSFRSFLLNLSPLVLKNVNIFFSSPVNITAPIIFEGTCSIKGRGNIISFDQNGAIVVAGGASLAIEDACIDGIVENSIACLDDTSSLKIKNSEWNQDTTYTFSAGTLMFQGEVVMSGKAMFQYTSSQPCTVLAYSDLTLDKDFYFYYNPSNFSDTVFSLADQNSVLNLNGSTLQIAAGGLTLTRGAMGVGRDSHIRIDGTGSLTLGSGSVCDDVELSIDGGVLLDVHGTFNYKNADEASLFLGNVSTTLFFDAGSHLNLYQSMSLKTGILAFGPGATLARAIDKQIKGIIQPQGELFYARL